MAGLHQLTLEEPFRDADVAAAEERSDLERQICRRLDEMGASQALADFVWLVYDLTRRGSPLVATGEQLRGLKHHSLIGLRQRLP